MNEILTQYQHEIIKQRYKIATSHEKLIINDMLEVFTYEQQINDFFLWCLY